MCSRVRRCSRATTFRSATHSLRACASLPAAVRRSYTGTAIHPWARVSQPASASAAYRHVVAFWHAACMPRAAAVCHAFYAAPLCSLQMVQSLSKTADAIGKRRSVRSATSRNQRASEAADGESLSEKCAVC